MPNTGLLIVLTLRQRNLTTNTLTGLTKPNLPGDPDYIPPAINLSLCPVTAGWECPIVTLISPGAGLLHYELPIPASVVANPAVAYAKAIVINSLLVEITSTITTIPPNYIGAIIGVPADTYTLDVAYYDSGNVELHRCIGVTPVVVL